MVVQTLRLLLHPRRCAAAAVDNLQCKTTDGYNYRKLSYFLAKIHRRKNARNLWRTETYFPLSSVQI